MTTEVIIGIDLGTTNSEVAVVENGQVTVIASEEGRILPSVVGLDDQGELLVGEAARNQYVLYPERTVRSVKRLMGEDTLLTLGSESYSPQEISAIILKRLKQIAEEYLGHAVAKAVITVPAYFSDAQRQATREAGEMAGLEVVRIINEPTAAALTYESQPDSRRKVLVYDLGGGTFDVSVVNIEQEVVEVLSSHGNNHLGGDDFDNKIVDFLLQELQKQHGVDLVNSSQGMARIRSAAERAKIALSEAPFVQIEEEYLTEKEGKPIHLTLEFSRQQFNEMIEGYINETLEATHIALKDAGMAASEVDKVLLVGGSTKSPIIRERLFREFGVEAHGEVNPDLCVATGAAIQGGLINHSNIATVLVDITPYTYGTSAIGEIDGNYTVDMFVPVIRKNSPLPLRKSEVFYTNFDGQDSVKVDIYQGESKHASDNILIGEFMIHGLQDVPAGNPIVLTLNLDLNGILHVIAVEKETGLEMGITIENAMAKSGSEDLRHAQERISALFPEGEAQPQAEVEVEEVEEEDPLITKARQLMLRGEAMMKEANEDDRADLGDLIEAIQDALDDNDMAAVERYSEELGDIIYYLES
ncbi:MAG: Hsp70 family protein [Gammaproteobacteria bacterium]|nr:Hsp70 family protein [Gammaproteobacteria bacterium]